jgi:sarcosine oxidase subunit gamma
VSPHTSAIISPHRYLRRSPLYRLHVQAEAQFEELEGTAIVAAYGDAGAGETEQAAALGVADLTPLSRIGFKGVGAPAWAESQGVEIPTRPNQSRSLHAGVVSARLSNEEILVLSDLAGKSRLPHTLENAWSRRTAVNTWLVPRGDSHCWFALTGAAAAETLSKLCAVDLRAHKFAATDIAQTSVAGCNAIVIRHDLLSHHCFYLLADLSLAQFLWEVLLDAMHEFSGKPVGIKALRSLSAQR